MFNGNRDILNLSVLQIKLSDHKYLKEMTSSSCYSCTCLAPPRLAFQLFCGASYLTFVLHTNNKVVVVLVVVFKKTRANDKLALNFSLFSLTAAAILLIFGATAFCRTCEAHF